MFRVATPLCTVFLAIIICLTRVATSSYTECSCICANTTIQATTTSFEKVTTKSRTDSSQSISQTKNSATLGTVTMDASQDFSSTVLDSQTTACHTDSVLSSPAIHENCGAVCDDVINGRVPDTPIGLASRGTEIELFPDFLGGEGVRVYCDCTVGSEEAWTVFQRRVDGSVNFLRNWTDYVNGFGSISGNFWLGLESLHNFTQSGEYNLRVDLEDFQGATAYAEYSSFSIGNSSTNYKISFGGVIAGDAGDALGLDDHYSNANGRPFTTIDQDNDNDDSNCAVEFKGAWWFNQCFGAHLNGVYHSKDQTQKLAHGIIWFTWRDYNTSLSRVEMKFRKI